MEAGGKLTVTKCLSKHWTRTGKAEGRRVGQAVGGKDEAICRQRRRRLRRICRWRNDPKKSAALWKMYNFSLRCLAS